MDVVAKLKVGADASVAGGDVGLALLDADVINADVVDAEVIDVNEVNEVNDEPRAGFMRRAWRALARVVARLRAVVARPEVEVVAAYARRQRRAWTRTAKHRAQRRWFGRQRSTSERCRANAVECRRAAKEAELPLVPLEYVGWAASWIETLRAEREALHPAPTGRHFVCS